MIAQESFNTIKEITMNSLVKINALTLICLTFKSSADILLESCISVSDQLSYFANNTSGAVIQFFFFADMPSDARSAGLWYWYIAIHQVRSLHDSLQVYLRRGISNQIIVILYVQKTVSSTGTSNSDFNILALRTATETNVNFSRGMVVCLNGATRALQITNEKWSAPSKLSCLKLNTVSYPCSLTYAEWCS